MFVEEINDFMNEGHLANKWEPGTLPGGVILLMNPIILYQL